MKKETQPIPLPYEVHPGIKLCRWLCLIAGIFHGAEKLNRVKIFDAPLREQARIMREIRRERIVREKAIAARAEMATLELLVIDDPGPMDNAKTNYDRRDGIPSEERARLNRIVELAEAEIAALNDNPMER